MAAISCVELLLGGATLDVMTVLDNDYYMCTDCYWPAAVICLRV